MNLTFDTSIFLLVCCLLHGSTGLRLVKVSIPAYKLRGESTFMECQYELGRVRTDGTYPRYPYSHHRSSSDGGQPDRNNGDDDSSDEGRAPYNRHMHYHSHSHAHSHHPRELHLPHFEAQVQSYQPQGFGGSYHHQQEPHPYQQQQQPHYAQQYEQQQQQQQQQQQHEQQQQQYPYQTPPSPYGHSIYRGRSSSTLYSGRVRANTFTATGGRGGGGGSYGAAANAERDNSFIESAENNEKGDEEEEEAEEEGEALYAIKWYKDNEEFYRYVPKAKPPKTSYRVDGIRVIEEHSDSSRVLLRGLTINSTGIYRCEVSAEAPNFSSVQAEGRMDVVYLPRDGPHIKGQQFQYQIGETLNLNCSSGKSHPASHLQWFINEQPVLEEEFLVRYNDTVHRHGLITSTLGLQMTVDTRHFHDGAMRVKCLASISPILWEGGRESVFQRRPGIIDNREAMLLVRSFSQSLHSRHPLRVLHILAVMAVSTKLCQLLINTDLA